MPYLWHITRGERYEMLRLIMQRNMKGRRTIRRRRISWFTNLEDWFNCSSKKLFRLIGIKLRISLVIYNLKRKMALNEIIQAIYTKAVIFNIFRWTILILNFIFWVIFSIIITLKTPFIIRLTGLKYFQDIFI